MSQNDKKGVGLAHFVVRQSYTSHSHTSLDLKGMISICVIELLSNSAL